MRKSKVMVFLLLALAALLLQIILSLGKPDKEAARVYLKQYGITQAPAILFSGHSGQAAVDGLGGIIGKGYSGETAGFRQLK